jgi:plasmid stability protein
MPNVLVRDVEVTVLDRLKLRAKRQNRSLQAEVKIILQNAAEQREPLTELELIRKIRASNTKVNKTDSVELLREDRDR